MKYSKVGLSASLIGAGMANPAAAQTNVTIYGVVDTFMTNIHATGVPSVTRMDASGLYPSRLGFKGNEDLGAGLKANFVLESGFNSQDGSQADSNRLFNRQSWVGLSSQWGEFRLGRQNTPQFYMNGKFDAFGGTTQASGWNNMFGATLRVDNAIGIFSPDMNGFKVQGLFGRGAIAGGTPLPEVSGNNNLHMAAEYEKGAFYAGINYEEISNTALAYKAKRTAVGTSYRINDQWKVFAAIDREIATDNSIDSNLYSVSALYSFTPVSSLAFGYAATRDHVTGKGHGNAVEPSVLYRYMLSKRTTLYSGYSHLKQQDNRNSFVLGGAAVVQSAARVASVPGGTINGVQLGIVHFF
ncbi:porin [Glaciimonas sp. PCH181]|uniref:porin n=1 Tax=Glaciimonas sp. PCH181 TaxID=2133943 RepID=UPI000D3C036A|nr:porin [Glaciimonas sp. PCH181]PUA19323.1 porin [Glaciimonas sp. PCH181]